MQANPKWEDNSIQFPRLLSEICATVDFTKEQMDELCESMDLEISDIDELFDRANDEWERIKSECIA
jgi:hypothetical protein